MPDLPGIAEARPWTNREATDSSDGAGPRFAVVGAGGVGVEMATAWQGLGSEVTLLARGPACCPGWSRSSASWSAAGSPKRASTCARVSR